jgi:hypothetical protein
MSHIIFLLTYFAFYGILSWHEEDSCVLMFAFLGLEVLPVEWIKANPWFVYLSVCFYSIGDAAFQFFPATMIGTHWLNFFIIPDICS